MQHVQVLSVARARPKVTHHAACNQRLQPAKSSGTAPALWAKVPDRQNACCMRCLSHGGHVLHGAGAVVDVREHQHGDLGCECPYKLIHLIGVVQLKRQAALIAQCFGNVKIGRKVAARVVFAIQQT